MPLFNFGRSFWMEYASRKELYQLSDTGVLTTLVRCPVIPLPTQIFYIQPYIFDSFSYFLCNGCSQCPCVSFNKPNKFFMNNSTLPNIAQRNGQLFSLRNVQCFVGKNRKYPSVLYFLNDAVSNLSSYAINQLVLYRFAAISRILCAVSK